MLDVDWSTYSLFQTPPSIRHAIDLGQAPTYDNVRRFVRKVVHTQYLIYLPDYLPPSIGDDVAEDTMRAIRATRAVIHETLVKKGASVIWLEPLTDALAKDPTSAWRICNWSWVIGSPDSIVKLRTANDGCVQPRKEVFKHAHIAPEVTHELSRPGHFAVVGRFFPDIHPFDIVSAQLSPLQIVHEFIKIINAAHYMHQAGWVHGDISDSNIVLHNNQALLTDLETALPIGAKAPILNTRAFREQTYYPKLDNQVRSPDTDTFALGIALLRSLVIDKVTFDRELTLLEQKSNENGLFGLVTKVLTLVGLPVLIPIVCGMLTQSRETRWALPIVISQMRQKLKTQTNLGSIY